MKLGDLRKGRGPYAKILCPTCGKRTTITENGVIWSHNAPKTKLLCESYRSSRKGP